MSLAFRCAAKDAVELRVKSDFKTESENLVGPELETVSLRKPHQRFPSNPPVLNIFPGFGADNILCEVGAIVWGSGPAPLPGA